jgi:hypothetical protein
MKCITLGLQTLLQKTVPEVDLAPLAGRQTGKLRLSPEQLLSVIHALVLAEWALALARRLRPSALPGGPGGKPQQNHDCSILLMALVQTVWQKSYEQIVDYVATHETLTIALGFTQRMPTGRLRTISKGHYWERRAALGLCPLAVSQGMVIKLLELETPLPVHDTRGKLSRLTAHKREAAVLKAQGKTCENGGNLRDAHPEQALL